MLCQHCKEKQATTHVKSIVNGEYTEYMLCSDCAKKMGYTNLWSDMHSDIDSLFGSFFANALPARSGATRCRVCGSTYHDIASSGKVGCANCYDLFFGELMPSIRRIHGNTVHCGKKPSKDNTVVDNTDNKSDNTDIQINELKSQLDAAVSEQNFELAAQLRDKIKELEESK